MTDVHGHGHDHGGRRLRDILELIDRSALDALVKERSSALFRRLAETEAAVHGTGVEDVHFHEVGAVDAIVDIVGGVIGAAVARRRALRGFAAATSVRARWRCSTARFLFRRRRPRGSSQGVPVYGAGEGELLTPTGALMVTAHATSYGPLPPMKLEAVGHGAGTRDPHDRPNVLRVFVGDEQPATANTQRVMVLEAEVDDMSPQLCGPLIERLLDAGALDAYLTPVLMKKGRPGFLITAVADVSAREAVEELLFRETTTLGVRRQEWDRTVLDREIVPVDTAYGAVGVKVGRRDGRVYNAQPEFEDCQRAAVAAGVPIKEVRAAALAAFRTR